MNPLPRAERAMFEAVNEYRRITCPPGFTLTRLLRLCVWVAGLWVVAVWLCLLLVKYVMSVRTVFIFQAIEVCKGAAFTVALLYAVISLLVWQQWRESK